MVAKLFTIVLAVCFIQAQGFVRRDAPAAKDNQLAEVQKQVETLAKTFSDQFSKLSTVKNTEEMNKVLKENSDQLLTHASELSSSINKALVDANGKAKTALTETATKLQQTVADLRKQNPEVEAKAKEISEKMTAAIQNTVGEAQKLSKSVAESASELGDKLTPAIKNAFDQFVKEAESIQKKIHEAATKA